MREFRNASLGLCSLVFLVGSAIGAGQAAAPSQRLLQELAGSNNLRAFAMSAMNRPAEGGIFYASYVADICGRDFASITKAGNAAVAKEIAANVTVSTSRLSMMSDLPQRCSAFVPGETTQMLNGLKSQAQSSSDPLVAAEKNLVAAWKSGRPDSMRAAVGRLMQLDDPLLWTRHRLYDYVAQSDPEAKRATGIFLNGKVYPANDGQRHLEVSIALDLGFCKRDLPCALDDELKMACASGGDCAQDRYEKARNYVLANGGTEANWKTVLTLVPQIQAALSAKNVSFFVR
jgi:hypothetical protein